MESHEVEKEKVTRWLRSITRGEFLRVISDVVDDWTMESSCTKSSYALACIDYDFGQEPIINLVAPEFDESFAFPMTERDSSFSESGACPRCNSVVVSVAKRAKCPVCGAEIECT